MAEKIFNGKGTQRTVLVHKPGDYYVDAQSFNAIINAPVLNQKSAESYFLQVLDEVLQLISDKRDVSLSRKDARVLTPWPLTTYGHLFLGCDVYIFNDGKGGFAQFAAYERKVAVYKILAHFTIEETTNSSIITTPIAAGVRTIKKYKKEKAPL